MHLNTEASQASIHSFGCRKLPRSNSVGFSLSAHFLVSASRLLGLSLDSVLTSNVDLSLWADPLAFHLEFFWGTSRRSLWLLSLLLIFVFSEVESIPPGPVLKCSLKDAGRLRYKFRKRTWQSIFMPHVFENILVTTNEGVNSAQKNAFQIVLF